jgi:hypothetical protein
VGRKPGADCQVDAANASALNAIDVDDLRAVERGERCADSEFVGELLHHRPRDVREAH